MRLNRVLVEEGDLLRICIPEEQQARRCKAGNQLKEAAVTILMHRSFLKVFSPFAVLLMIKVCAVKAVDSSKVFHQLKKPRVYHRHLNGSLLHILKEELDRKLAFRFSSL
jgi:hypothetical protein